MRLTHLLGAPGDGGAETYFLSLIGALKRAGYDQAAITRPWPSRDARLRALGLPLQNAPFLPALVWPTRLIADRFARRQKTAIMLSWMSRAAHGAPRGPWKRIGRLGGYYSLKYFRGHDFLVGNTPDIVEFIVSQGWPRDLVSYIPNFAASGGSERASRASHDTPEDVPLLLGLGRLHSDKAHDVSLRALVDVPEAYLWIAGSGPLEAELKTLARELGVADRVRFLGWVDDPSPLYRAADVCVFPSRVEPMGNVVIQAWAHDLPIVTAASKGPAFLVRPGEDAVLCPLEDHAAVAEGVKALIADAALRARFITAGRQRIETEFSEQVVVAAWAALFERFGLKRP
jgi:glycosyltransferase involved in cell wall biosynthesis